MINLCCSLCSKTLAPLDALCFFNKVPELHLIIKPNILDLPLPYSENSIQTIASAPYITSKCNIIVEKNTNPKKEKMTPYKLHCKSCGVVLEKHLGSLCRIGPSNDPVYCFSLAKKEKESGVFLSPRAPIKSWKESEAFLNKIIEVRTEANFEKGNKIKKKLNLILESKILLFKDIKKLNEINLTEMIPRQYQIESFLQSITMNTILCLPTGTGKTLVAFMFLRYFVSQNPSKLAIFLAPKISLVQQQYDKFCEEIIDQQKTHVFCFTSENTFQEMQNFLSEFSEYIQKKDFNRNYVIFLTPQKFLNLIETKELSIYNCSAVVFDEAHNAVRNNPYNNLMKHYMNISDKLKPALLGLTASLAGEETLEKTKDLLNEISDNLKSSPFMPNIFIEELEETKNNIEIINEHFKMNKTELSLHEAIEKFIIMKAIGELHMEKF